MCGIAGLVGLDEQTEAVSAVRVMVGELARRGPDGEGVEAWEAAVLGHRRLSIFDLSEAGRQPMLSPDRAVGVVFNGAIYNFWELRADLRERGYEFRSRTDTEVLVHGYREWGIDGLVGRLRGMFAFGLWDERRRALFLVRDRLGVKPLVYASRGGRVAFASTVRALRRCGVVGELDPGAVAEYLHFGYVTDDSSIYRGAVKVPAATIVEFAAGREPRAREYWRPPSAGTSKVDSFAEAVEEAEGRFLRAVKLRLQADVAVGALLSGGVDSSLVCWAIARLGGDVTAYTVGVPGDPQDESADARLTARQLGIRHQVIDISSEDGTDASELALAYAEPFACASALGMLGLSRAIAPSATVLLTGDGGDDVFLGYHEHRHLWAAERLARAVPAPAFHGLRALRAGLPRAGLLRRAGSFIDYATGGLGAVTRANDGLPMCRRQGLLGGRLADVTIRQLELPRSREAGRRVLEDYLDFDRRTRFVGEFLPKVDGATMHYALEARSPFLDQELWEFAASLPFGLRLHGGQLKAVLRGLARRALGERVARGHKRGFSVPAQRWLVGRWRGAVEETMRESVLGEEGWINPRAFLAELGRAAEVGRAPLQLWHAYVLELWMRHERTLTADVELGTPPAACSIGRLGVQASAREQRAASWNE